MCSLFGNGNVQIWVCSNLSAWKFPAEISVFLWACKESLLKVQTLCKSCKIHVVFRGFYWKCKQLKKKFFSHCYSPELIILKNICHIGIHHDSLQQLRKNDFNTHFHMHSFCCWACTTRWHPSYIYDWTNTSSWEKQSLHATFFVAVFLLLGWYIHDLSICECCQCYF